MIDVNNLVKIQFQNIIDWHTQISATNNDTPWSFIIENNMWNFKLWHEEDIARIKDISPKKISNAKRNIDKFNQYRNNAMEKIDEWILEYLELCNIEKSVELHSETPGMMIDRLSILSLKKYHMFEETKRLDVNSDHIISCSQKLKILEEQINDLANCLENVLKKLVNGKLNFKVYRQFKMYNDPNLNPEIYRRK